MNWNLQQCAVRSMSMTLNNFHYGVVWSPLKNKSYLKCMISLFCLWFLLAFHLKSHVLFSVFTLLVPNFYLHIKVLKSHWILLQQFVGVARDEGDTIQTPEVSCSGSDGQLGEESSCRFDGWNIGACVVRAPTFRIDKCILKGFHEL